LRVILLIATSITSLTLVIASLLLRGVALQIDRIMMPHKD